MLLVIVNHNPSKRRVQKVTSSLSTFVLETFGGHSSALDGLWLIFLARNYKKEYRTSTNRTESVEMCDMHLVICLAKKYKTEYRTSTNRTE